jgi:hypothetical protein
MRQQQQGLANRVLLHAGEAHEGDAVLSAAQDPRKPAKVCLVAAMRKMLCTLELRV